MREAVIISGRESRHGAQDVAASARMLTQGGLSIVESHVVSDRKQLQKRVKYALKSGHKLILVSGGDGGIGLNVETAVDTIINGRIAHVDLGRVNGNYFAKFSTIGLTAEVGARAGSSASQVLSHRR